MAKAKVMCGMNLKRVWAIFLRQMFLLQKSAHRVFGVFYWSSLELFLWGFLTVYLNKVGGQGLRFVSVVLGTVILWNFLLRVQQGVGISFLEDVWVRNFINLFSSPLTISEYVLGLVLVSVANAFISTAFMAVLAWFLFAYNLFQFGFLMIPFIFILFFFGLSLGLFTTAVVLRFGPSSEILAWSIPALLPPFSGIYYPVSALPKWLQYLAYVLPPSHIFEGMRSIILSGAFDWKSLLFAILLSMAFFAMAYWFLLRSYRFVLRTGRLLRFLTE